MCVCVCVFQMGVHDDYAEGKVEHLKMGKVACANLPSLSLAVGGLDSQR